MAECVIRGDRIDADALNRDGYIVTELLDYPAIAALRETGEALIQQLRCGFDSTLLSADLGLRVAAHRAVRAAIAERISALMTGVRIAFCSFVAKSAESDASEVPLHQDWSFVDETRHASFGLWCPLVDVDPANGCLQVVPGSHAAAHPPRAVFAPFRYQHLAEELRASHLVAVPMQAGQAVLFDNRLIHGSPPNRSRRPRVAATAVLVPSEARLRYYHMVDRRDPDRIEVFEVADSFYLTHAVPRRPEDVASLGILEVARR